MGTSNSVAEFGAKIVRAGQEMEKVNTAAVAASALVYKDAVIASGKAATGGDGQLSRWGKDRTKVGFKGGVKLNARYDLENTGGKAQAVLKAVPMGVWKVVEYGAGAHAIVPGTTAKMRKGANLISAMMGGADTAQALSGARKGAKRRKVMAWGNGNFAAYTRHPGTKGKKAWSNGIKAGTPSAVGAYKRKQVEALGKVF
jgi:hypothetical protein